MELIELKADLRDKIGTRNSRRNRVKGIVPGILYGKEIESKSVSVDTKEINRIIKQYGNNVIINLQLDAEKTPVMLKEVQRDNIKGDLYHIDFIKISLKDKIEITVPISLEGSAKGEKEGGIIQQQLREATINVLPTAIPDSITVDISDLEIGDSVSIADLEVDEEVIEILNEPEEVIASLVAPRMEEEEEEGEELEGDEQPKEPEVIGEEKEEE